jgi:hypothetical protein
MTRRELVACGSVVLALGMGIVATTGEVARGLECWGNYDWDYFFFQAFSTHRALFEFHELPLWNPWYMGGVSSIGNFQSHFPSPWLALDIVAGPVVAIKLKIIAQQTIGVAAMYWMARGSRMSRLAAVYVSGTFFFSSWVALRVHSGHLTYLSTAYTPLLVGLFHRARVGDRAMLGLGAGAVVALMFVLGGVYDIIFASFLLVPLTLIWCVQDRSPGLLLFAVLVGAWALGLSAVKLFPVAAYMRENPRLTDHEESGSPRDPEDRSDTSAGARAVAMPSADETETAVPGSDEASQPAAGGLSPEELPKFMALVFLGRQQHSNRMYSPLQRFGWHEYGAYIGPLAILLALASRWLAFRQSWPWLLIASTCLVVSAGDYSAFAPWTLLHKLPVFNAMHCPSRFLIPCVFAVSMAAGLALDGLRDAFTGPRRPIACLVTSLLVGAALVDSVLVFRSSIQDAFPKQPPVVLPAQLNIVTILGDQWNMTLPMLANQCTAAGYEPICSRAWVEPREFPNYHGETFFLPDAPGALLGKAEMASWSPNTVTVHVTCAAAGSVVLNRNWNKGWRADAPYRATPLNGLIAASVPPGEHWIRFVFIPSDFWLGSYVSLATVTLSGILLLRRYRRRAGTTTPGVSREQSGAVPAVLAI